jgi:hypothetical protein
MRNLFAFRITNFFPGQRSNNSRKLFGHLKDLLVLVRALTSAEIATIQAGI